MLTWCSRWTLASQKVAEHARRQALATLRRTVAGDVRRIRCLRRNPSIHSSEARSTSPTCLVDPGPHPAETVAQTKPCLVKRACSRWLSWEAILLSRVLSIRSKFSPLPHLSLNTCQSLWAPSQKDRISRSSPGFSNTSRTRLTGCEGRPPSFTSVL